MGFIDKIKSFFTKQDQPQITQAGTGISAHFSGNYGYSDSYGSGSKFPGGLRSSPIMMTDHFTSRQNARRAVYDSNVAKAMVDRYSDTVVDTGLKLKPTPDAEILGITPEQAEEWSEKVAGRFHLWAKSKKSHRSRINNFYQNQRLYHSFQQRDNDIFVRFYYGRDKDLYNPLQLDFVDPNQIRGHAYTSSYMQTSKDDGIKRDPAGREIGYYYWELKENGEHKEKYVPAIGEKSKRILMIHGFNPEYAGQGRGFSRLNHVLQEFSEITDFSTSTIQKAINQSSFVGVIENEHQDASQPLEGRVAAAIREYGTTPSPDPNATNVTQDSTEPVVNFNAMPEATITQPGSALIGNLRKGDKMKYLQDTSPGESYDSFINNFVSYMSASNGMPIEVLLMKFNQNYSASRGALILFWRVAQIWRNEMTSDFCDPVYESWLSNEIATGRITAPGWSDPFMKDAWLMNEWAGSPMPNIDPLKTANADREYVELGAQTLDDVARNLNGSSGKANRTKNSRQFADLPTPPWPRKPIEQIPDKEDD